MQIMTKYSYIKMHALKETHFWWPRDRSDENDSRRKVQQALWCHSFSVVEFVVNKVHKRKEASMSSSCELCQHPFFTSTLERSTNETKSSTVLSSKNLHQQRSQVILDGVITLCSECIVITVAVLWNTSIVLIGNKYELWQTMKFTI